MKSNPLKQVHLNASVLLQIMKHCRDLSVAGNGQLLGMEIDGVLQITHSVAVATKTSEEETETDDSEHQIKMMKNLRLLNYDANSVGWYQTTFLGSFWNQGLIETQYEYQKTLEHAVVLLYDPIKTAGGAASIRALRLTDQFMEMFPEKFTMDRIVQNQFQTSDIFEELPVSVKNSSLATALLAQMQDFDQIDASVQPSWSFKSKIPAEQDHLVPNFNILEQRSCQLLEKQFEYLNETIEEYGQEQWRWHGWQRSVSKEQQKLHAMIQKRKQDAKDAPTEEEIQQVTVNLSRMIANEPSRLESLVISNQIETYCDQIEDFTVSRQAKLETIKALVK